MLLISIYINCFVLIVLAAAQDGLTGMFLKSQGSCKAGTVYRIEDRKDLENEQFHPELECIFTAGKVPSKVPYGTYNLQIIRVFSTRLLNPILEAIFTGKYVTRVTCNVGENGTDSTADILWNNMGGTPRAPAGVRVGNVNNLMSNLDDGEYYDRRDSLIFDHGDDVGARCPSYATPDGQRGLIVPKIETGNYFPIDQSFGLVRLVGIQSDGGRIYLGKVYIRSPFDSKVGFLSYITFLNYDMDVNPTFRHGDALDALPKSYSYTIGSLLNLLQKVFPVNKFIGFSRKNRLARKKARAELYSIISRNRQLAKTFRADRRYHGAQQRYKIDRRFSSAFKANIYQ